MQGGAGTILAETGMNCQKCGTVCERDSVDIGVGVMHGPYGCPNCRWSEAEEFDLSDGRDAHDEHGGTIDQYGGYYPGPK